jgi:hypothetical protein
VRKGSEKEDGSLADSPGASPKQTSRKDARIKLRRSLTSMGAAVQQAVEKAKADAKAAGTSPAATGGTSDSRSSATSLQFPLSSSASKSASGSATPAVLSRSPSASPMPEQGRASGGELSSMVSNSRGSGGVEEVNGVLYITREEVKVEKSKVFIIDAARIAKEKAEKAEKERKVKERAAEQKRKKQEEAAEKLKKSSEAAAAKEASRLARERMTNLLAEQSKAKRLAAEEAEKERLANGVTTTEGSVRRIKLTPSARTKEAEAEARRKAEREMHPDFDAEEAEDAVPPPEDDAPEKEDSTPAPRRAHTRTSSRATISGGLASLLQKAAPRAAKQAKKLIGTRMVNAAKKGDVEELRKILLEEFGKSASPDKLNKTAETKAEFMNRVDKNGSGVLHHSVWPGHVEFMAAALSAGANPNLQNTRKNGAIHLAVERGHEDVIRLLLRYGSDPILINSNGHAPFQVLPSLKEQLQWASFLYLTLEAIWKVANPEWVPEVEREQENGQQQQEEGEEEGNGTKTPDAGSRTPDASSAGAKTPEAAGTISPAAPIASAVAVPESGSTTPGVAPSHSDDLSSSPSTLALLDSSHDYTPLVSLNPATPVWLAELSSVFQKKDIARIHTKQLQSKVLTVMRMGLLKGIASAALAAKPAAATPEGSLSPPQSGLMRSPSPQDRSMSPLPGDLTSPPSSARSTLAPGVKPPPSTAPNGLASLLRKMKVTKKGSTGSGGGGSGKNSQRSSVEAGGATPPIGNSRRSSNEGAKVKTPSAVAPTTPVTVAATPVAATSPAATPASSGSLDAASTPANAAASPEATPAPAAAPVHAPLKFTLDLAPQPVPTGPVAAVKTSSIFSASIEDMYEKPEEKKKASSSFWPFKK